MAVKEQPAPTAQKPLLVKNFIPTLRRHTVFLIIVLQALVLLALALILHTLGFFNNNPVGVATTLIVQSILGIIASLVIYQFVAKPIKTLLAALVHVAGEPTAQTPPNPNELHFERSGLKPVLQTIYELASSAKNPIEEGLQQAGARQSDVSSQENLKASLDQTLCGVVMMSAQRTITYANKAAPLNLSVDGVPSLRLIFNEHDSLDTWLAECEASSVHAEKTWTRIPDGLADQEGRRFFDVIATYEKGAANEVVLALIDRTKLYSIDEDGLDFIAFAAHELRGPITVIRGYVDVLSSELSGVLDTDQVELFHRLTVSSNRLSGYINNILNTSRYDRRHLKMHLTETSVKSVYDTIRDDMALRASSQNRLLAIDIPDNLPTIAGDTASLSEVFGNLIDNAIKYSNEGGDIIVKGISKGDTVEISIQDHGIGMPSSVVSNLFQKFYRSHRSRETVAGTGIGLYISKAIVESHGGTISVRSEDGHGSTFTVSLPTYTMVADKLKNNNSNETLIGDGGSWIKNHNMYRG